MDTRSAAEAKDIMRVAKGDPALQVNSGGNGPLSAEWMIPKAMWLKRYCSQWQKTKYLCEKQDYLNYLLTGEFCASGCNVAARWHWDGESAYDLDVSLSSIDQRRRGRPVSLLKSLDLEDLLDRWPVRCVPMGGLVGYVTQKAATTLHLPAGIPVFQGGPDAYVGMIGLGIAGNRPDGLALITGSSHLHLTLTDPSVRGDKGYWGPYRGAPLLGQAFAEGGQSSTGSVLAWLRRLLNGHKDNDSNGVVSFKELDEEALLVPIGSDGLMSLTTFQGSRTPLTDPKLRGAFVGLSLAHSRGHLWRACLEGVCFGTRAAIDALPSERESNDQQSRKPIILAGGVSRSHLWLQMTADVTNRSVITAEIDNSPLIGGAILAAAGYKLMQQQQLKPENSNRERIHAIVTSVRDTSVRFIKEKQHIFPNQTAVTLYDFAYQRYLRMTSSILPVCRVVNTNNASPSFDNSNHSVQIMPSLLAADGGFLFQEVTRCLLLGVKAFHLDICDGGTDCGGSLTLGTASVKAVHKAISSFGFRDKEIIVEVHLVADYSLSLLKQLAEAGTTRILLQVERLQSISEIDNKALTDTSLAIMKLASSLGMDVGLCLAPQTDVAVLNPLLNLEWNFNGENKRVRHVNILCVKPGFGGQSFDHTCLSKVQYLHKNFLLSRKLHSIAVDGGVSKDTVKKALEAGATVLVAGTSIFGANREHPVHMNDDSSVTAYSELMKLSASLYMPQF